MFFSAFTIIRNAIKLDYPIIESVKSLLPFVDEYVVNIGKCDDGTKELLHDNFGDNSKVIMFDSEWEESRYGTAFFSNQTNLAMERCTGDWCIMLQADELMHERDAVKLKDLILEVENKNLDGITFKYLHFIKDFKHIRKTYSDGFDVYEKELRLFRNDGSLMSFGDAQSFCYLEDALDQRGAQPALHRKERFLDSDLNIYHYGWLKDPVKLLEKKKYLKEFYDITHPDRNEKIPEANGQYVIDENSIKEFQGSHPRVMRSRMGIF